jgi:hypothetical protein
MKKLLRTLILLGIVPVAGCGKVILRANFQGWPQGSPAGPPPGQPGDDQITVQNAGNPAVSGSQLVFHLPAQNAYFFSHPVQVLSANRTAFWIGQLKEGNGPFSVLISGDDTPGTPFLTNPLIFQFTSNEVKVIDHSNNVLHSHALNPNGEHQVFLSLRLQSGTYSINIKQPGASEIVLSGSLSPLTANWIKSQPRLLMQASFLAGGASGTNEYVMRDVIMREKQ